MGNNRISKAFSGLGSQIINAGKEEVKKTEEETATTKEDNVIPIKKEEEIPPHEQEQSKVVAVNQTEVIQQKHDDNLFIIDIDDSEVEKKYCNFYLSKKTIDLIEKYAGKKKEGKSGMNKSQLVDFLLQQAFTVINIKK